MQAVSDIHTKLENIGDMLGHETLEEQDMLQASQMVLPTKHEEDGQEDKGITESIIAEGDTGKAGNIEDTENCKTVKLETNVVTPAGGEDVNKPEDCWCPCTTPLSRIYNYLLFLISHNKTAYETSNLSYLVPNKL